MMIEMCRAKIHRLTVTEKNVDYEGSITIDKLLLEESGILQNEKVQVVNVTNGERFETYVMAGRPGSGETCLNGAAAHLAQVGDIIIVIAYAQMSEEEVKDFKPRIIYVNHENKIVRKSGMEVIINKKEGV